MEFPGGPVVTNPSCNTGVSGLTPGRGTNIPHDSEQLSLRATTTDCVLQWKILQDPTKILCDNKDLMQPKINKKKMTF